MSETETINSFHAIKLIENIYCQTFETNKALKNFCKSTGFNRELYELFNVFKNLEITYEFLLKTIENIDISVEDKTRLKLVFKVFEQYNSELKRLNLSDEKKLTIFEQNEIKINEEPTEMNDILARALFIVQKFNNKKNNFQLKKSENIEYQTFQDVIDELEFISNEILNSPEQINETAIIINNFSDKNLIINYLQSKNVPIKNVIMSEDFEILKTQFIKYLEIFNILKTLNINDFESNINPKNKTATEIAQYTEILNQIFSELIERKFNNPFNFHKISNTNSTSHSGFLSNTIFKNYSLLENEEETKKELLNIKNAYKLFIENRFEEIFAYCFKNFAQTKEDELFNENFKKLYKKLEKFINFSTNFKNYSKITEDLIEITNNFQINSENTQSGITVLTFSEPSIQSYERIFIPFLTADSFPKRHTSINYISQISNETISNAIKSTVPNFKTLIKSEDNLIKENSKLFYKTLLMAKSKATLTTHCYENKKNVIPSIFFEILIQNDPENVTETPKKNLQLNKLAKISPQEQSDKDFCPVIGENETIFLSASSTENFLKCPRKYYYKNLLGIKENNTFNINYGLILHTIMEIFNKTCLNSYKAETLKNLAKELFSMKEIEIFDENSKFDKNTFELIKNESELSLIEMENDISNAIDLMEKNGYFNVAPNKIDAEIDFEFSCEKIPKAKIIGRIDAIISYDNHAELIDFKSGKSTNVSKKLNDIQKNKLVKPDFSYQIPYYYWATKYSEKLKTHNPKINNFGLKYIRPEYKKDGYENDVITAETLENVEDLLIENINKNVIDEIRNTTEFKSKLNSFNCKNCSYKVLCESEQGGDYE